MKFKRQLIDKLCGDWNATRGRFERRIVQVYRYQAEAEIGGKSYVLELFKQTDGWRLGIYGMLFGKEFHFRTVEEANEKAEQAFRDYLYWQGEDKLRRQEYEYKRYSSQPVLNCPDRHLHCHAECEKYKEYKDILERNRAIEYGKTDEANFRRTMKGEVYKRYMKHRKVDGRG